MFRLGQILEPLSRSNSHARVLVEKVIVSPRDIEVGLRQTGIEDLALELRLAVPEEIVA